MLLQRLRIKGHSMEPNFREEETVLLSSIPYFFRKPKIGDVVVFINKNILLIKRIKNIEKGKYYLLGDNLNDSSDSRDLGWIERKDIMGIILFKI